MRRLARIKMIMFWISIALLLCVLLVLKERNTLLKSNQFLVLEKQEGKICPFLTFEIGGEMRTIKAFEAMGRFYFFIPSGASGKKVKMFNKTGLTFCQREKDIKQFEYIEINNQNEAEIACAERAEILDLYFMQEENVATLFVDIDQEVKELSNNKEKVGKGKAFVYDVKTDIAQKENIRFKGHGNGSFVNSEKKSWRIKFEQETSVLGMAKGKEYVAIANALDKSYLRNWIVYDMAEKAGFHYTPHGEYINLYVNDEYQGLYLLSERIEVSEERVDLTKGFLFKEDTEKKEGYELEENEFMTNDEARFKIIFPKVLSQEKILSLQKMIENLQAGIACDSGICTTVWNEEKHYSEIIDLDSFIKKYLIEEISKNRDGNRRSSYYYIYDIEEDMKIYAGPVWDYDIAFGNWWGSVEWKNPQGIVRYRLGFDEREEFMQMAKAYYSAYFEPYLRESEYTLRECSRYIEDSVAMDQMRWNEGCFLKEAYYENVEELINFIKDRKEFLDAVWILDKTYHRVNYVDGNEIVKNIYVENGTRLEEYVPEMGGKAFLGWYDEALEEEWDLQQIVTDDMALWAKWE